MARLLPWIAALVLFAAVAAAHSQERHEFTLVPVYPPATDAAKAAVRIAIEHGKPTANNGPGFLVTVRGWTPAGLIAMSLHGSKGESVDVLPPTQPVQTGTDGVATVLVPYQLQGVTPGAWKILVDGASGKHEVAVQIPVVVPPDATHKDVRLVFPPGSPDAGTKAGDASKAIAPKHH